jgi:hypothetical protein
VFAGTAVRGAERELPRNVATRIEQEREEMNIQGMAHVNVNCSDFDRSRAFYEMLGFEVVWEVEPVGSPAISAAVGMPPYRVKGAVMALGGNRGRRRSICWSGKILRTGRRRIRISITWGWHGWRW